MRSEFPLVNVEDKFLESWDNYELCINNLPNYRDREMSVHEGNLMDYFNIKNENVVGLLFYLEDQRKPLPKSTGMNSRQPFTLI